MKSRKQDIGLDKPIFFLCMHFTVIHVHFSSNWFFTLDVSRQAELKLVQNRHDD